MAPPQDEAGGGWTSGLPLTATAAFLGLYALVAAPFALREGFELEGCCSRACLRLTLAALSAIDLDVYRLPDALTLPLTALGVAATPGDGGLVMVAGRPPRSLALPCWRVSPSPTPSSRGRPGLGLGDAKLLAAAGAWLGMQALPSVLLLACGSALLGLLIRGWRTGSLSATSRVPFGPFLAFGTWLGLALRTALSAVV